MERRQVRRAALIAAFLTLVAVATWKANGSESGSFGQHAALAAIDQYRARVSPLLRGHVVCRFTPTCSTYGRESIRRYGLLRGGARTIWRIGRCGPWTPMGTVDRP